MVQMTSEATWSGLCLGTGLRGEGVALSFLNEKRNVSWFTTSAADAFVPGTGRDMMRFSKKDKRKALLLTAIAQWRRAPSAPEHAAAVGGAA